MSENFPTPQTHLFRGIFQGKPPKPPRKSLTSAADLRASSILPQMISISMGLLSHKHVTYHISWSRLDPFKVMTVTRSPTTSNGFMQPPPKTSTGMIAEVVNWAISHQWKLRSTFNGPPKWLDPLEQIHRNSAPKPRQLCLALRQQCLRGDVIPESPVIFRKSTMFFFLHAPKRSNGRILLK